jgi:hypothetical protein
VDWLTQYLELTEGLPTPPVFRLWSGIFALGANMERRTWLHTAYGLTYPNLFCLLLSPPGEGKSVAMKPAQKLLVRSKSVMMAPDDMTKAALLDEMNEHNRRILVKGETIVYHPLCIMASELGNLVNAHDLEFFSLLSNLFDNPDTPHKSRRRGHNSGKPIELPHPNLNILACCPPAFLGDLLPPSAWQQGFTSRLIMIYAPAKPETDLFAVRDEQASLEAELTKGLVDRAKLLGAFRISDEAKKIIQLWISGGLKPVPQHEQLAHYRSRRVHHLLKLAMIAASSARGELHVIGDDVTRAKGWLLAAETVMPDIFRDMGAKSDGQLLGELHRFVWDLWVQSHAKIELRRAVPRASIMQFLALRCPADKALRVLELACQMDWLQQLPDTLLFVPKARGFSSDGS